MVLVFLKFILILTLTKYLLESAQLDFIEFKQACRCEIQVFVNKLIKCMQIALGEYHFHYASKTKLQTGNRKLV
jgi:hypothetical protein